MQFHSRSELEMMDPIALLWEQFYVAEAILECEKRILKHRWEIALSSDQLQEATGRRHTVVFPFEEKSRRETPVLRELRHILLQKYEDVKKAEETLGTIQEYCDLIRDILEKSISFLERREGDAILKSELNATSFWDFVQSFWLYQKLARGK